MVKVALHPDARAEYRAAWTWYRARSKQAAGRFRDEFDRVIEIIKSNPALFPVYEGDIRYAGLARFPYSVIYQVQPAFIYVIAVAHSARSEGYW